jgi:hypothetical protein
MQRMRDNQQTQNMGARPNMINSGYAMRANAAARNGLVNGMPRNEMAKQM